MHYGGGGVSSREQRSRAHSRRGDVSENWIAGSAAACFFYDSDSDSDDAFQILRNHGLVHVEFFCVLVQQLCSWPTPLEWSRKKITAQLGQS
jgi:hypothetical protein